VVGMLAGGLAFFYGLGITAGRHVQASQVVDDPQEEDEEEAIAVGELVEGLPEYSNDEIKKHTTPETGIWVRYKAGVYDITSFVEAHPGGNKILLAAGGSIEPFWALYGVHKSNQVYQMLEENRIGNLAKADREAEVFKPPGEGPWAHEPERHAVLIVRSAQPFNGETPADLLTYSFHTPNSLFYVRNHLPVPLIDPKEYQLEIAIEGGKTVKLSLDDLKEKFPKKTITASLQCTGNRRNEMKQVKDVKGLDWGVGAIGNAEWTGVALRDILNYAGLSNEAEELKHVQFEGLDCDIVQCYGASIPLHKALDPRGDVILAFEMNGEPLPLDHGYPVRVISPGLTGARSVKWVGKIIASKEESPAHWQQKDYKSFSPSVDWTNVEWSTAPAIQDTPVQSAICEPKNGDIISHDEEEITLKGFAYAGGGRAIIRVDVSSDGGKTWRTAELLQDPKQKEEYNRMWGWTLWEATVPMPTDAKDGASVELICKATDSAYNDQPDTVAPTWNLRGVLTHSWHRVNIRVE